MKVLSEVLPTVLQGVLPSVLREIGGAPGSTSGSALSVGRRNPRGIFPTKTLGEFCGGFSGGLFPWEKQDEKIHGKNPQQNSNQNLGVSWRKSTLQGSGLSWISHFSTPVTGGWDCRDSAVIPR